MEQTNNIVFKKCDDLIVWNKNPRFGEFPPELDVNYINDDKQIKELISNESDYGINNSEKKLLKFRKLFNILLDDGYKDEEIILIRQNKFGKNVVLEGNCLVSAIKILNYLKQIILDGLDDLLIISRKITTMRLK